MEHLNSCNEEKSTVCGREFHTFTKSLSVKKFLRTAKYWLFNLKFSLKVTHPLKIAELVRSLCHS